MPEIECLDHGIILFAHPDWQLRLSQLYADNITDEDGIIEGDPRNPTSTNGRYIMPASYKFSVGYEF